MGKDPWDFGGPTLGEIFRDTSGSQNPFLPDNLEQKSVGLARFINGALLRQKADRAYQRVLPRYGPEVAEQVHKAVLHRRDPQPILDRAEQLIRLREERERQLENPPPIYGSAQWTAPDELGVLLRGAEALDHPTSLLLGTVLEHGRLRGQLHWDGRGGHLLTVAATRTGKGHSVLVPNLLRYQGSCVVLDPKGELYALTSRQRRRFGRVLRLAPLDDGTDPHTKAWRRDTFNPLAFIRNVTDARHLAQAMLPKDPRSAEFFNKDAVAFLESLLMFVVLELPPVTRNLSTVVELLSGSLIDFRDNVVLVMAASPHDSVRDGAQAVLNKASRSSSDPLAALSTLRETLNTDLAIWRAETVLKALCGDDVDFRRLKHETVTVYVDVPFHQMATYAPVLQVILQSALDAMVTERRVPDRHVLFMLDEFLALGPFEAFRNAINTHGGAGVRFWFFIQNIASLRTHYPGDAWRTFFDAAVVQYFGVNEFTTARELSERLGNRTVAQRSVSESGSLSAPIGWEQGQSGYGSTVSESVQFFGRPLRTPDEVLADLSPWRGEDHRGGYVRSNDHNTWAQVELFGYRHALWKDRFASQTGPLLATDR